MVAALCQVDWGALATFSTGVLAVGAALFVGLKQSVISQRQADIQSEQVNIQKQQTAIQAEQVSIQRRQTEILAQQAGIAERVALTDEARMRHDLLGDRWKFIQTVNSFIRRVKANRDVWAEEDIAFLDGAKQAEWIFPRALSPMIGNLWKLGGEYQSYGEDLHVSDEIKVNVAREKRRILRDKLDQAAKEFDDLCQKVVRPLDD